MYEVVDRMTGEVHGLYKTYKAAFYAARQSVRWMVREVSKGV